jgi:hypothetical protein
MGNANPNGVEANTSDVTGQGAQRSFHLVVAC